MILVESIDHETQVDFCDCLFYASLYNLSHSLLVDYVSMKRIYPSKVKEAPTLCAAWLRFWVSSEAPRPRVTPVPSLTL